MWIALFVNAGMFLVELAGGWNAGSGSLLADAIDFFGDAANYGLSLFVLALAPVWRSRTALIKGITMGSYGVFVLGTAAWNVAAGVLPEPATMGVIGFLAAARKQGKYWQALEALLASQSNWTQHHTARVDLVWSQLEGLGLDIDRMRSDMQSPEIDRLIQQDLADVKALNVTKTPEFFVNRRPLPSFGDQQLPDLIRDELEKAPQKN